jgi:ABC-2 type transport system ATP-binding protein
MLQRIGIAQAILNDPQVLFLDEPFSGLDPVGRRELREIVRELNSRGVTIFFSSHILSDVESLCNRFAILFGGKLVDSGQLHDAIGGESQTVEIIATGVPGGVCQELKNRGVELVVLGERVKLLVSRGSGIASVIEAVERNHGVVVSVNPVRPSLEELFLRQIDSATYRISAETRKIERPG